ncbi:polysaccharide deacetylase [Haloterrigena salina JCM 13891]|uniref:Polysaccharide deacetylase n=2 Tax=Haloterrigena salina TaxID=504937 RepID=M0C7Z7_9EURY|nr:polysaccharide deacetylase family protein [Haloterrigena salina]ELZ18753.1 polysaccharide deacetylase [Haloterrigena salina JCM 13891]
MVVFTYDDGAIEDYTMTYPVHERYDVPACIGVCPDLVQLSDDFLDPNHVGELHDAGWEVMSHTNRHRSVGRILLESDAEVGHDRIYVQANRHGDHVGDPLVLFDGERTVEATVAGKGSDDKGQYIRLEEPIDQPLDATNPAYVRYTESFLRTILSDSKRRIEDWGIDVTGFVYPYGRTDGLAESLVPEYYDAVPNYRTGVGGINPIDDLEPTQLHRRYIETDRSTPDEIEKFMATVASEDVLGMVGGHSEYDTLPAERIEFTIETALDHDLRIVTLQDALTELGYLD